jgi:hypothetical protein
MPKPAAAAESTRRRRWKIEEARSVLDASGLSLSEFAIQKGLQPERLRRWQRRLAREVRAATPATPGVIELRPRPSLRSAEPIEILLGSGVTLRVAETIDPATLARLIAALDRGC